MSAVTQEASEAMRQLQKLSKELNPVKTALNALKRRELATPSPEAAAASLEKIATRLESVCAKYHPFIARLDELTEQDLPQLFLQTPLLTAEDEALAKDIHLANHLTHQHHKEKEAGGMNNNGSSGSKDKDKDSHGSSHSSSIIMGDHGGSASLTEAGRKDAPAATSAQPAAAGLTPADTGAPLLPLLGQVCPVNMPYALGAENYRLAHDQLRMRVDMVDYLIDTGRLDLAQHVAAAYQLPRLWFPRLHPRAEEEEGEREGEAGMDHTVHTATGVTASPQSARLATTTTTTTMAMNSLETTPSHGDGSPLAATLHRTHVKDASHAEGSADHSTTPVRPTLPSTNTTLHSDRKHSPSSSLSAPERPLTHHSSPSATITNTSNMGNTNANAPAATAAVVGLSPSISASSKYTRPNPLLSVLASRVVAAGMYLKDEYFDRLVLERFAELRGFSAPNTAIAATPPSPLNHNALNNNEDNDEDDEDGTTSNGNGRATRKAWTNETTQGRLRHKHENKFRSFFNLGEIRSLLFGPSNGNGSAGQRGSQGDGAFSSRNNNNGNGSRGSGSGAVQPGPEDTERAYDTLLLNRVYHLPHSHLCTQSDSALFDRAMMHIVEELLAHALVKAGGEHGAATEQQQQQSASSTTTTSARDDAAHSAAAAPPRKQRSVESDSVARGKDMKDSMSLVRRHLTPLELLGAEDAFSNHTMVIKRPTRYYCMLTGSCMNDVTSRAYPVALGSGAVVSHQAVHERALCEAGMTSETTKDATRTKAEHTPLSQPVRRLFVT